VYRVGAAAVDPSTTQPGCVITKPKGTQEKYMRFLLTFRTSNRNILRSCIAHARYWAVTKGLGTIRIPSRGKVPQRRHFNGNEEEGYQESCQEEKEVSDHGEANGLALSL
jgi:hypothetical protein